MHPIYFLTALSLLPQVIWVVAGDNVNTYEIRSTVEKWRETYDTIRKRKHDDWPKSEHEKCKATVEETESWFYLKNLFEDKAITGVTRYGWPLREFFISKLSKVVDKTQEELEGLKFCSWYAHKLICVEDFCISCKSKVLHDSGLADNDTEKLICGEKLQPPTPDANQPASDETLKNIFLPPAEPSGDTKMTLDEVWGWITELKNQDAAFIRLKKEKKEEMVDFKAMPYRCNASVPMSVSMAFLMEDKFFNVTKIEVEKELKKDWAGYERNLSGLIGMKRDRKFCGSTYFAPMICGWDGVCLDCDDVMRTKEEPELANACWTMIQGYKETKMVTEETETTTKKSDGSFVRTHMTGICGLLLVLWISM